jgi:hypothetical protein
LVLNFKKGRKMMKIARKSRDLAKNSPGSSANGALKSLVVMRAAAMLLGILCQQARAGAAFVTPPGHWHSHVNESGHPARLLPIQDAGLHTYLRSLDIRFASGLAGEG